MNYVQQHLRESIQIIEKLDAAVIEKMVAALVAVRSGGGRLFILGVGGSAANASHAVNDFRKICGFEAYAPTDNVSELTARTNDEGWATVLSEWLKGSRLGGKDGLLVFSVGGGNLEKNVSPNLVSDIQLAKQVGAAGSTYPAVFNAANEQAVLAFHAGRIGYLDILAAVAAVVDTHEPKGMDLDAVFEAERWAREHADGFIAARP